MCGSTLALATSLTLRFSPPFSIWRRTSSLSTEKSARFSWMSRVTSVALQCIDQIAHIFKHWGAVRQAVAGRQHDVVDT